jgi:hypothetical protein
MVGDRAMRSGSWQAQACRGRGRGGGGQMFGISVYPFPSGGQLMPATLLLAPPWILDLPTALHRFSFLYLAQALLC